MNRSYTLLSVILLSGLLLHLGQTGQAQIVKRLYIANDDHTDYMWSGDEAQYDSAFVKTLDYHIERIAATRNNPADFQDRFNCDGSYWLKAYQKYRSPAQFNKLIEAIKSGHISSQLNSVVSTFGAQPTEAAIRGMYYAGQLERQYNLRFTMASAMENNTLPLGLISLWAGSGAKYSFKGIGGYGSQLSYPSRASRQHQLYYALGLDSAKVLTKWYAYNEKTTGSFGGYAECRLDMKSKNIPQELGDVIKMLDAFCDTISAGSKYPYSIGGAFGYGHDDLQTLISDPFIQAAQAHTTATRRVCVSNEEDFFKDVARTYPKLPTQAVSFGNEWDLLCASMQETTAEERRAVEKLRTAEALAALVSLKAPNFANKFISARNLAWDALGLYWEHNWTGDGPVANKTRGAWQVKMKDQLSSYVDSLHQLASRNLGNQLKKTANPRFFVFNPLSWVRDDVADVAFSGTEPVQVFDMSTNKEVPSQVFQKDGKQYLRLLATQVPSVGYKIYEIRKGNGAQPAAAATLTGEYIDSPWYRVRLSPAGVITEILDKKAGNRQLVKATDGKYLNDLGSTNINEGNKLEIENAGPVSVTFKAVSKNPIEHTVRLTLYAHNARLEIQNSIDANFKETQTWTFSFNLDNPTTHHEELGAILKVKKENRGGHYAVQNARYDWQTFNHFADLSTADYGITLSNLDCSFFKLGKSTVDSLWENSAQISALAGGQIDRKVEDKNLLGIHNQFGQTSFTYHFALQPHANAFNPTAAMKFAMAHQNPLATGLLTGGAKAENTTQFSLLQVNNPDVVLWSLKPAEEGIGQGLITRFWNVTNQPAQPGIKLYRPIVSAWQTSHLETNEQKLKPAKGSIQATFRPQQLNTYRLGLKKIK